MSILKLLPLLTAILLLHSCGSDKEAPAETIVIPSSLFESTEQAETIFSNNKSKLSELVVNNVKQIGECMLDDEFSFNEDGTYNLAINSPCEKDESDEHGTWEVIKGENKFYLALNINSEEEEIFEIVSREGTKIKLKSIIQDENKKIIKKLYTIILSNIED